MEQDGKNIIKDKAFDLALEVLSVYREVAREDKVSCDIWGRILQMSVQVGVNVIDAQSGRDKHNFLCKMNRALVKARVISYWLDLLAQAWHVKDGSGGFRADYSKLKKANLAVIKILSKIIKTANGKK